VTIGSGPTCSPSMGICSSCNFSKTAWFMKSLMFRQ